MTSAYRTFTLCLLTFSVCVSLLGGHVHGAGCTVGPNSVTCPDFDQVGDSPDVKRYGATRPLTGSGNQDLSVPQGGKVLRIIGDGEGCQGNGCSCTVVDGSKQTRGYQGGAAFTTNRVALGSQGSFSTTFTYMMSCLEVGGADGFTFSLTGNPYDPNAWYNIGGGLSLDYRSSTSVAVEFDIYNNGDSGCNNDPDNNHIGLDYNVTTGCNLPGHPARAVVAPLGNFDITGSRGVASSTPRTVWIDYDGPTTTIKVYIASVGQPKPSTPALHDSNFPIATVLGNTAAYVGFTGASGGVGLNIDILSWTFTGATPPPISCKGQSPELYSIDAQQACQAPVPAATTLLSGKAATDTTYTIDWIDSAEHGPPTPAQRLPTGNHPFQLSATRGGLSSSCIGSVFVADNEDLHANLLACNAPAKITPPQAGTPAASFTATYPPKANGCGVNVSVVQGVQGSPVTCDACAGNGKHVARACVAAANGPTLSITDSGGVQDYIRWVVQATDGTIRGPVLRNCGVCVDSPTAANKMQLCDSSWVPENPAPCH